MVLAPPVWKLDCGNRVTPFGPQQVVGDGDEDFLLAERRKERLRARAEFLMQKVWTGSKNLHFSLKTCQVILMLQIQGHF